MTSSPPTATLSTSAHCIALALLSCILMSSYVTAKSIQSPPAVLPHADTKRFYIPVIISSDAILASLKDGQGSEGSEMIPDNGLERKRTSARLEYLDSLLPRSVEPKRKMFWSPLGYMSASARRLNQNNPNKGSSDKEDAGSLGFRYG